MAGLLPKVVLTIVREGHDGSIDLTLIREKIQIQPTQVGPPK
jgi:C-terminal processing protease CtpA/Prc